MKKVQYFKRFEKDVLSICLTYDLFEDNESEVQKILEILKLFCLEELSIRSEFFVIKDHSFLNEVENTVGHKADILFTRKRFFGTSEYRKLSIAFEGPILSKVVKLAIEHGEMLEIDCLREEIIVIKIALNDNDGHHFKFNTSNYDIKNIKANIDQILNG